jgi:hypothetical protein
MVCTSIGLTVKGVPVVGVIYNPFLDQLVRNLLHLLVHPPSFPVRLISPTLFPVSISFISNLPVIESCVLLRLLSEVTTLISY